MKAHIVLTIGILVPSAHGLDNGLALTPPRGWRSWNCYTCTDSDACAKDPDTCDMASNNVLTESKMKRAMHGVLDKSRKLHDGTTTSLADLGYSWVSMDDGWQGCNCSTHQMIDNSLPVCSIGDCRGGECNWHDSVTGAPHVKGEDSSQPESNTNRFPSGMKALVDYGHSLGLKVGSYLNNCICMEAGHNPTHYEEDVKWLVETGFDEVKIDNCGSSHNVTLYSELFNKTGKAIRIEDCHTYPGHSSFDKDGEFFCPMNMFRAGGDIHADFGSIIGEIHSTLQWNDQKVPLSRPGCWAYPDMMQVGNFNGDEPRRSNEERSHFGLWSINSAPLVLGFDLGDKERMDRVWPIISNTDALSVNEQWAGHPGTLVKTYPASGLMMVTQAESRAESGGGGWRLSKGMLITPGGSEQDPLCLSPDEGFCPPTTTAGGVTQCGLTIVECSKVDWAQVGTWNQSASGQLMNQNKHHGGPKCLYTRKGQPVNETTMQRSSDSVSLGQCQDSSSDETWTFTESGELHNGDGVFLEASAANGLELWSKPLVGGKVAILVLNPLDVSQTLSLPLADVPQLQCGTSCAVRDVWKQEDSVLQGPALSISLSSHESAYYILSKTNFEVI